jgi:hypothetical protein
MSEELVLPESIYDTTDAYESGHHLTKGVPYRGTKLVGNTVHFLFKETENLRDHIIAFQNDQPVPARTFSQNIRFILAELKKVKRNGGGR